MQQEQTFKLTVFAIPMPHCLQLIFRKFCLYILGSRWKSCCSNHVIKKLSCQNYQRRKTKWLKDTIKNHSIVH